MEDDSILLVIWCGRLLLPSPFCFNCRTCYINFPAEVLSIPRHVKQVAVEFLHKEDVVLLVGMCGTVLADEAVDSTFEATLRMGGRYW